MAIFNPSIMGSDNAFDYEYQIVTACNINYGEYLRNYKILNRFIFEKNFGNILRVMNYRDPIAYQVLGVLALKTGAYLPDKYKKIILKFCKFKYDRTIWQDRVKIRKIYLDDLRNKIQNYSLGERSYPINLQIDNDRELESTSIGINQFIKFRKIKCYKRIRHINLDSCDLYILPKTISNFQFLESLSLNNNFLEFLTSDVCDLPFLKVLSVRNNLLKSLPDILSNLEVLDLTNNQLTQLPISIRKISSLKYLYLSNNPVSGSLFKFDPFSKFTAL